MLADVEDHTRATRMNSAEMTGVRSRQSAFRGVSGHPPRIGDVVEQCIGKSKLALVPHSGTTQISVGKPDVLVGTTVAKA